MTAALDNVDIQYTYHQHTSDCYTNHPQVTGKYKGAHCTGSGDWGWEITATCSRCGHIEVSYNVGNNWEHGCLVVEGRSHVCQAAYTSLDCGKTESTVETATVVFK